MGLLGLTVLLAGSIDITVYILGLPLTVGMSAPCSMQKTPISKTVVRGRWKTCSSQSCYTVGSDTRHPQGFRGLPQKMSRHRGLRHKLSADVATLRLAPKPFSRCRDTAAGSRNFQFVIRRGRKLRKATVTFVMYVCPSFRRHGTTLLTLDGSSCSCTLVICSTIVATSLSDFG